MRYMKLYFLSPYSVKWEYIATWNQELSSHTRRGHNSYIWSILTQELKGSLINTLYVKSGPMSLITWVQVSRGLEWEQNSQTLHIRIISQDGGSRLSSVSATHSLLKLKPAFTCTQSTLVWKLLGCERCIHPFSFKKMSKYQNFLPIRKPIEKLKVCVSQYKYSSNESRVMV